MSVRVIGAEKLGVDMETMRKLIREPELATRPLDALMRKHVRVRTGFLKSTIYHKGNVAGASAPYAGWVEEMGGKYAYATKAIKSFDMDAYADDVVEPF